MELHPATVSRLAFGHAIGTALVILIVGCGGDTPVAPSAAPPLPLAEQRLAPGVVALRVAVVGGYRDSAAVSVPAIAHAGEPVAIGVTTYGGGCVSEDTTVVTVTGAQAEIIPYQRVYTPRADRSEGCTLELRIARRQVQVTFAAPGRSQVEVISRDNATGPLVHTVRTIDVE
jgi:hypothetical protein